MSLDVVGLDLSLNHTGIAYPGGSTEVLEPTKLRGTARHAAVRSAVLERVRGADVIVLEAPFVARMDQVTQDILMLHGVVAVTLWANRIPVARLAPSTLKLYATGHGHASKIGMRDALHERTLLRITDDNEVDAWWLRAAGRARYGTPVVSLPDEQTAALDAGVWPSIDTIAATVL